MVITYETNCDETHYTFYSLNVGDVFTIEEYGEEHGDSIFVKVDCHNAFDLVYNKLVTIITSGCSVHKLNAELIIHERAKGTGIY